MIGEAVYMTNWYYLPGKDILDLIQIILRSSMVIKITAGKLVHMSIYTFGNVSHMLIHICIYLLITVKCIVTSGDENCFHLFKSIASTDLTKCTCNSMYKLVRFRDKD